MAEKTWWKNPWTCGVGGCCFGCIAIPLIIVGVFGVGVVGMVSQSGVYQEATELVANHPSVIEAVGEPVDVGWPRDVSINLDNDKGKAQLRFPVTGPKGSGMVHVEARKSDGKWEYRKLQLRVDGTSERIDLLTLEAPIGAVTSDDAAGTY